MRITRRTKKAFPATAAAYRNAKILLSSGPRHHHPSLAVPCPDPSAEIRVPELFVSFKWAYPLTATPEMDKQITRTQTRDISQVGGVDKIRR